MDRVAGRARTPSRAELGRSLVSPDEGGGWPGGPALPFPLVVDGSRQAAPIAQGAHSAARRQPRWTEVAAGQRARRPLSVADPNAGRARTPLCAELGRSLVSPDEGGGWPGGPALPFPLVVDGSRQAVPIAQGAHSAARRQPRWTEVAAGQRARRPLSVADPSAGRARTPLCAELGRSLVSPDEGGGWPGGPALPFPLVVDGSRQAAPIAQGAHSAARRQPRWTEVAAGQRARRPLSVADPNAGRARTPLRAELGRSLVSPDEGGGWPGGPALPFPLVVDGSRQAVPIAVGRALRCAPQAAVDLSSRGTRRIARPAGTGLSFARSQRQRLDLCSKANLTRL